MTLAVLSGGLLAAAAKNRPVLESPPAMSKLKEPLGTSGSFYA